VEHTIKIKDSNPIKQTLRCILFHLRKEFDKIIEKMRQQGVIEESCNSWVSFVVLIKKKDGSIRFCVNYRKLNVFITIKCFYYYYYKRFLSYSANK